MVDYANAPLCTGMLYLPRAFITFTWTNSQGAFSNFVSELTQRAEEIMVKELAQIKN